jgi:DNA invertase Pin-like site-specific DNA recombinase
MFQMLGVFAEFERAMIVERVKAGLERAPSEGKRLGRPMLSPDKERRVRDLLAAGTLNALPCTCGFRPASRRSKTRAARLKERGVAFRSLTEQMNTTTPQGEFLFHVFGAMAQFERSLTQERVRAGLEAARRRGRRGGRPVAIDCRKNDGRRRGARRRSVESCGLSHLWDQAQHAHRHLGSDRLACRCEISREYERCADNN